MNKPSDEDRFTWQSADDVTITSPSPQAQSFTLRTNIEDDDVDESTDLDSEIEELEKLLAQKRYQARPFTIRHVPILSKG